MSYMHVRLNHILANEKANPTSATINAAKGASGLKAPESPESRPFGKRPPGLSIDDGESA